MDPYQTLESLFAENRITAYEVQREAGRFRVTLDYLEFDADSPEGSPCTSVERGASLSATIAFAMRSLPEVKK